MHHTHPTNNVSFYAFELGSCAIESYLNERKPKINLMRDDNNNNNNNNNNNKKQTNQTNQTWRLIQLHAPIQVEPLIFVDFSQENTRFKVWSCIGS
jgi:hypothetical protein